MAVFWVAAKASVFSMILTDRFRLGAEHYVNIGMLYTRGIKSLVLFAP